MENFYRKIMGIRRALLCGFFILFLQIQFLEAVINSKNKITVIDTPYTFTDFEYARGFISFKNGFSLTPTKTVILEVYYPIEGAINLNNGTIIMNDELLLGNRCSFYGNGYIKSNGYQICLLNSSFSITSTLYFIDDVFFDGKMATRLSVDKDKGILNFEKASSVTFANIDFIINNATKNLIFPAANLTTFSLINSHFFMTDTNTLAVKAATFSIDGHTTIETIGILSSNSIFRVEPAAVLEVMPFSQLAVQDVFLGGVESFFVFNNQSRFYLNKVGTTGFGGNGVFKINGTVYFHGTGPTRIVGMNANQGLLLGAGARLITENMYFRIVFS